MKSRGFRRAAAVAAVIVATLGASTRAEASHSWGGYHWARTANPFTLKLGNNLSSKWNSFLGTASSDWSQSTVLDTTIVAGATNPRNCKATNGTVQVCNSTYGSTGWLGVAQIWLSGSHITRGSVKVNDTYFDTATYNTPAWRNRVMCQEVGPTLGLDHQDTIFENTNLNTCMDYTNDPGTNQHPNQHDYDELGSIYGHVDDSTTVAGALSTPGGKGADSSDWGRRVSGSTKPGTVAGYVKDLGGGDFVVTFVINA